MARALLSCVSMRLRERHTYAWLSPYLADRGRLLLSRIQLGAALTLPGVVGLTAYKVMLEPESFTLRVWLAAAYVAGFLIFGTASFLPVGRRRPLGTALGFTLALVSTSVVAWRVTPQDVDLAPLNLLSLIMGTTLLFPWGPLPQALVCLVSVAGYAWVIAHAATPLQGYALGLMATIVPISLVGAQLLESSRRASFERTWQKEQLVSLARDLANEVDAGHVFETVLRHGLELLGAHGASVMLHDQSHELYRVEATAGALARSGAGTEIPDGISLVRATLERDALALPEDDPAIPVVAEHGARHALYVAMRLAGDAMGILCFVRGGEVPFGPGDRVLARGLADQAALALRTARLVADLRRVNQLKSEFVSTMSHELRTPLNVILGFAEMARDAHTDADARDEHLARIETAGRELLGLIESTLEIGKLEAHRDTIRLEKVVLPAFWAELGEACARLPRRPGVALEWSDHVPAVVLETDPRKLTIVLRNLLGNALKFTEHGHVRAEVWLDAARVCLRVSDTGIGIRPEDQEAIFEMFRQADGSDSRRYGGTGLGLYIVRRFVEQLGGTITLESMPGRGSTFTVQLGGATQPLTPARAA